jgi:hypothetical protein
MTRPDHVVLAGHTGRLLARVGLHCHTRWETDEHVVKTAIAAGRDLGRPVTGPELHDLWEAAHTIYTQVRPVELRHVEELLISVGRAYRRASGTINIAIARNAERVSEQRGMAVLRQMVATSPAHTLDSLPNWLTEPEALDERDEVWTW